MRILRVEHQGRAFYAALEESQEAGEERLTCLQSHLAINRPLALSEVRILPLVAPSKVICVGLNYADHAAELNFSLRKEPAFFLKPPSAIIGNGQAICLPPNVGRVDYEAELAIVIGQACAHIRPEEAPDYIFGYTCANDVTARDLQKDEPMFGRSKGYDTFCPIGPWIETVAPPMHSAIRTVINGKVKQEGTLADMLVKPLDLVSYISSIMTLLPGDLILTGTPKGVGSIEEGDTVQIEIENVGVLFNGVNAPFITPLAQGGETRLLQ